MSSPRWSGTATDARPGLRALARERNFSLLWRGQVLSEMGSEITAIALPLLVLSLTGSAASAGLVGAAGALARPLASLPSGVLADRVDRRRLVLACSGARMLASASVAIALALGRPPLAQLLIVAFTDAALGSTAAVAERGLVAQIVAEQALADAVTINEARSWAAVVAGPPLGGALYGIARALPFLTDTFSFLAAVGALSLMRARTIVRAAPAPGLRGVAGDIRAGLAWLWSVPFLRAGALLYAAANASIASLTLLALLIAHSHGSSSAAIGAMFAIVGAGGLAGSAVAGPLRRRLSARLAVLAEPWAYALLTPLLLAVHSAAAVGLIVGAMFLPITLSSSVVVGLRLRLAPDELRGRAQASAAFVGSAFTWVGPLAVGIVFEHYGEKTAVIAVTVWAALVAVWASLVPALRRPAEEPGQTGTADV